MTFEEEINIASHPQGAKYGKTRPGRYLHEKRVREAIDKFVNQCAYNPDIIDTPCRTKHRRFKEQAEIFKKELGL